MNDKKSCYICGTTSKTNEQFYMTTKEWVDYLINIDGELLTHDLISLLEYGEQFPNKRFCPQCFNIIRKMFE